MLVEACPNKPITLKICEICDLLVALTNISLTSAALTSRRVAPMPSHVSAAISLLRVTIQASPNYNLLLFVFVPLLSFEGQVTGYLVIF